MASVLIIGAGWLGRALGSELSHSHRVVVTNTTPASVAQSRALGLNSHMLALPIAQADAFCDLLQQHKIDIIIGGFTPGFRSAPPQAWHAYADKWQQIAELAQSCKVKKLVMISTTGVYPASDADMSEEAASIAIANQEPGRFSDKSLALLQAEQQVINSGLPYVVIRCSGLVDELRHPSRFVRHLKSVSDRAPANMLHKQDAVGITQYACEHWGNQVVNASTPQTCSKAQFYRAALDARGITDPLPPVDQKPDKRINSDKSVHLGYCYHYQHTLDLL